VSIMTFFSTVSTGNAQDNDNFPHTSIIDTPYFSSMEVSSFSFLNEKADSTVPLYADYQTKRNEFDLSNFETKYIIKGGDIRYINEGYLVLRIAELQRKQGLTFSPDGFGADTYRYQIDSSNAESNIVTNLASTSRVYSNESVQIFYIIE
jgi:uncharacterized membrane protein